MANDSENIADREQEMVAPLVTRRDLETNWIGLGAALDWILCCGQPMHDHDVRDRQNEAEAQFVAVMTDLPSHIAESVVRGVLQYEDVPLGPIPSGIWAQTATSDANDRGKPFRLIGTDADHPDGELDGSIHGLRKPGYLRIQVRTDFVLDHWPENNSVIASQKVQAAAAAAEVRRWIEMVIALWPADYLPLTQDEIVDLIRSILPNARRDLVRDAYRALQPNRKRGPRAGHNPERAKQIAEFREKMISAQLHN